MNVTELNNEQILELKNNIFWNRIDYEKINDREEDILDGISCPEDIPDDVVFKKYDGITFTDDDFFCNIK